MNSTALAHPDQAPADLEPSIIESLVLNGDIAALEAMQRVDYYVYRCRQLGIDPAELPFQLIKLDGKLTLYPKKECAQALTRIHRLSVEVRSKHIDEDGMMTVCARAIGPDGSFVDDDGVLDLNGIDIIGGTNQWGKKIAGIGRANGMMKCVTKAKRRAVLAKCGLGGFDAEDVAGSKIYDMSLATGELSEAPDHVIEAQPVVGGRRSAAGPVLPRNKPDGQTVQQRLIAAIDRAAEAEGVKKNRMYSTALEGAGISPEDYGGRCPAPDGLSEDDAAGVLAWLDETHPQEPAEAGPP